jgi:SAM-dependent methyltransferase
MSRAEREKHAYDEERVFESSHRWHARFRHVFECPNTLAHERLFQDTVRRAAAGGRVLELGCGDGANAQDLLKLGAAQVRGIDISDTLIARAREKEVPGRLDFLQRDASEPIEGTYELIVGRAVLHHIDYREALKRLHASNLAQGGTMVFMEPLAGNPLIRAFGWVAPGAHTRDERSFERADLRWFESTFDRSEIVPFNWLSLPAGLLSSLVFTSADNVLTRLADRFDRWLAVRARWLAPQFRQAVVIVRN